MKKYSAFSLIEVMIALGIAAIILVAVMSAINPIQQINKGKDATRRSDLAVISSGLEQLYADIGRYPTASCFETALTSSDPTCNGNVTPPMKEIPEDPVSSLSYCYSEVDAVLQSYILCACMQADSSNVVPSGMTACMTCPVGDGIFCITNPF